MGPQFRQGLATGSGLSGMQSVNGGLVEQRCWCSIVAGGMNNGFNAMSSVVGKTGPVVRLAGTGEAGVDHVPKDRRDIQGIETYRDA